MSNRSLRRVKKFQGASARTTRGAIANADLEAMEIDTVTLVDAPEPMNATSVSINDGTNIWAVNGHVDVASPIIQEGLRETLKRAALGEDTIVDLCVYPSQFVPGILLRFNSAAVAKEVEQRAWISQCGGFPYSGTMWHFYMISDDALLKLTNPLLWKQRQSNKATLALEKQNEVEQEEWRWWNAWNADDPILRKKYIVFLTHSMSNSVFIDGMRILMRKLYLDIISASELVEKQPQRKPFAFVEVKGRVDVLERLGTIFLDDLWLEFRQAKVRCSDSPSIKP